MICLNAFKLITKTDRFFLSSPTPQHEYIFNWSFTLAGIQSTKILIINNSKMLHFFYIINRCNKTKHEIKFFSLINLHIMTYSFWISVINFTGLKISYRVCFHFILNQFNDEFIAFQMIFVLLVKIFQNIVYKLWISYDIFHQTWPSPITE